MLGVVPRLLRCDNGTETSHWHNFSRSFDIMILSVCPVSIVLFTEEVFPTKQMRLNGESWDVKEWRDFKDSNEFDELNPLHIYWLSEDLFRSIKLSWTWQNSCKIVFTLYTCTKESWCALWKSWLNKLCCWSIWWSQSWRKSRPKRC